MEFDASTATTERGIDFPKLELKKEEKARVCIYSTKGWVVSVRHWVKGIGYVHCHAMLSPKVGSPADLLRIEEEGGRPEDCILCANAAAGNERVSLPYRRFAIRVLRYRTDTHGKASAGQLNFWLEIWVIDNRKYRSLMTKLDEWGGKNRKDIFKHDLLLTCEDEKYQNVTIDVMKDAWWLNDKEGVKNFLSEEVKKHNLFECLGQTFDKESLERRFAFFRRRETTESPVDFAPGETAPSLDTPAGAAVAGGDDVFDFESKGAEKGEVPAVETEKGEDADFLDDILKEEE